MNILVTGDSGFIGSYLTKHLEDAGHSVFGVDINPQKKYTVRYPYYVGDILDAKTLSAVPTDRQCIIHLAAAHKDFGITKDEYFRVNVDGMKSLLQFANERQIKKFIFYSTVAVYGDHQPSTESTDPNPINYYGSSKLEAEKVLTSWAKEDIKREVVIIRPSVVFGPLNVANIFKLIKQVCDGRFIWVGTGKNIKSIAYVENLVAATHFLLQKMGPGCSTFNYSDEPHYKTEELVSMIAEIAGTKVPGFHIPLSLAVTIAAVFDIAGRVMRYDFPITSARIQKFNTSTMHLSGKIRDAGFHPAFTVEEGLRKNVRWYQANRGNSITEVDSQSE